MKHCSILFLFILSGLLSAKAQQVHNYYSKKVSLAPDSVILDSLTVIPGSVIIVKDNQVMDTTIYRFDETNNIIYWLDRNRKPTDSITVNYRVLPFNFYKPVFKRDRNLLSIKNSKDNLQGYVESPTLAGNSLFALDGLNRSGSISRGITVGSNQDAVVSSSLNLQIAGKLTGDIDILAAITDDNIPIQADGNTQQLQEFDKVFIQLSNPNHKLIAGDFETRNPGSYFLRYYKKGQGGLYSYHGTVNAGKNNTPGLLTASAGAAVSKGRFARNTFNGNEGNQGPYRLTGAESELFIVILSGSERIFIDGQLLQRGQDRDYVIDYNTAELKFTPRRLITKDTRIVAEFQYSDRNYARTMITASTSYQQNKLETTVAFYSEQDSKNQPLQQDLTGPEKLLLANAGDQLTQAVTPRADSVGFNINEILYARRDTVVNGNSYSAIYVYSTSPDSGYYRVSFSNTGLNKGNYIIIEGNTNGRVFQWVAPVNSVPQGSYEPVVQLVSPKLRRMLTAGASYAFSKNFNAGVELAGSRNDINLFSKYDKYNDQGGAVKVTATYHRKLDSLSGWEVISSFQSEATGKNFTAIENFRPVEFTRDWNIPGLLISDDELLNNIQAGIRKGNSGEIHYGLRTYQRGNIYKGLMHNAGGFIKVLRFNLKGEGSYLSTGGSLIHSNFIRHKEEVNRPLGNWTPGLRFEQEHNAIYDSINPGFLRSGAFSFRTGEAFILRTDTVRIPVAVSVSRRIDDAISRNVFREATIADMVSASTGLKTKGSRYGLSVNYRNLYIHDSLITSIRPDESITGRAEASTTAAKGGVQLTGFYEAGTGREPKKTYSYVQVAPGTGVYAWNDYNGDGIPQLNEFEIAAYQDQATYIRILAPTDQYVKVYFNQLNAVINISPTAWMQNKKALLSLFALQSSVRFDNRLTGSSLAEGWNPLPASIPDSQLISTQASNRHTLFFNRSNSDFNSDISWQKVQSKQLLANGVEEQKNSSLTLNARSNINTWLNVQLQLEEGLRSSHADAFTGRDYNIQRLKAAPKINIQPGSVYRLSLTYRYETKVNTLTEGLNERAIINDGGIEWRYSTVKQGVLTAKFNILRIAYNGDANTSIAYEMLEALKEGTNLTWGLSLQRNLGNSLQVSVNYDGRKPSGISVIHTGSAQVRAFF